MTFPTPGAGGLPGLNTGLSAAASSVAPAAAGGGGFLSMLAAPGVGTALTLGVGMLSSLFGASDQAEQAAFQAEVQRQENEKARAAQRSAQSQQEVSQSFQRGAQVENQISQNTLSALSQFLR